MTALPSSTSSPPAIIVNINNAAETGLFEHSMQEMTIRDFDLSGCIWNESLGFPSVIMQRIVNGAGKSVSNFAIG